MHYFLFGKGGRTTPEFIRGFQTIPALKKFVDADIKGLKDAFPDEDFSTSDYFVTERINIFKRKQHAKGK